MPPQASALPLAHLRVLELGGGVALAYAGKLFADFGAEVFKLEPPGGDPLRRMPPLLRTAHGEESAIFAWLNTNKRSITAEPGTPAGDDKVRSLLAGCDVLLDSRSPAARAENPLGPSQPGLIAAGLSWFGDHGPYRDFAATDATCRALSGIFACTGPAAGPPAMLGGIAGEITGGIAAFNGIAGALWSGAARQLEISIHEANIAVAEYQASQSVTNPEIEQRFGVNRFAPTCPLGVYPCREGWLGVTIVTPAQFRGFCEMLDLPALAQDPRFVIGADRLLHVAELEAQFMPRLEQRRAAEWFEEAMRRRLPFAVVPDMATLLATPTHRARNAFAQVQIGGAVFEGPTLPQRLTRTPPLSTGSAPRAGEADALPPPTPRPPSRQHAPSLPLAGLRIVDLSMGWAGPLCTRQLGDLGAEIIKVEACQYPDWWRGVDPRSAFFTEQRYEKDVRFGILNRNKAGITLDLTTPEGVGLLKHLVRDADAVVENYSREVLPKLGLDYASLSAEKPDLVMLSMPAFGLRGPWADARAYGSTLEHASGLPSVSGQEDWPPTTNQLAYGDPIGGLNGAAALLVALLHRRRTGEGQQIDLAQVECMFPLVAPWIIAQSVTGGPGPRLGNRHPTQSPHGCFPCLEQGWVTVAVTDDAAWQALCRTIERPDLGADPTLSEIEGRRGRQDELETAIAAWTRARTADAAMLALQASGVAAGAVRWPSGLKQDAHLLQRGFWQRIDRPLLGPHDQPSAPFREVGQGPYPVRRPAPTLGQDNEAVLGGLLGLSEVELLALSKTGIIGCEAVPVSLRRAKGKPA